MAKYRVQGPDGRVHVFEGPDGASPSDVEAFAAQTFGSDKASKAKAQQDADRKLYDPTKDMSGFDTFAAGMGKAAYDTARGIGQLLPESLGGISRKEVDEVKARDAALMNTTGGTVGNIAGNIGMALPTLAIPGAATLRGAALIGATQGSIAPVGTEDSRLQNSALGAAAGAGGIAIGRGLSGLYQGGKALIEPFSQGGREKIAGRVIQRFADDPTKVAAAKGGQSITGATPTIAEETADAGMARLQDSLRSVDPQIAGRIDARLAGNNAARVNALEGLAGNDATRSAAMDARKSATQDLYQQATKANYTVDPTLDNLLQRPAVKQAMARAQSLAENNGRSATFNVTPNTPFSGVGGLSGGESKQITGQSLQDLKMAMDEMLTDPSSGFTGKAGNTIKDLRGQIVDWMEKANPDFKAARKGYADASKPLNQMDVGAALLNKGASNTSDLAGNVRLMPNKLTGMLKDENALIQAATGRKGVGSSLSDVLTPEQEKLVRTVVGEVDRTGAVARAGNGPGSATAQRMASQNVLSRLIGPTGLPSSWAESALANTVVGKPLNLLYGGVAEPKIQQALAEAVLDPVKAAKFLASAQQQGIKLPQNAITQLMGQAARIAPSTLAVNRDR
jgi:hypothetical protein